MDVLVNSLITLNVMLAVAWVVACMARMDQRYAAQVRAEYERKSILRGKRRE